MKQIIYAGGSIITGSAVADALVEYATSVATTATTVAVKIPVLEPSGKTTIHTILVGPATQFDVSDVDGLPKHQEEELFPVPDLPIIGSVAVSVASDAATLDAKHFNAAVNAVDAAADS